MPTNNNGETQTDALNLTETAKQVDHEVEIGFYDYGFADQITFFEAADTIGAGEGEDLNRMSEPWNENFQITFASEVEDTAAAEERATNYDPWDDNAHLYQVDQNLLAMINLANESDTFHTVEDPTLDSEDPGEAPWNTVENENPIEPEQITPTEQTRGQKLAGLARDIAKQAAPVVIGMGVKMAVKSSLAGTVGGPVLAGLAGGLGTAAVTAAKLQNGDTGMNLHISEDIDKSGVSEIHDRYVMKQKRRAEKGGKINKVLSIINAPEQWAVERVYKTEEREKQIDEQLLALGIEIKPDENGHAYLNTIDGRKLTDILTQANTKPEDSDEPSQLDILIQRMAVQARLAKHSTSTMEGMREAKKDLFLRACVIRKDGEGSIEALQDTLEAAKNEFAAKEKLATVGMIAGISAVKSAFKGAIGVALAEGVMGTNIEDALESGIEYVGDKFEYVSEALQEKTEQLVGLLGQLKENGAKLINELTSREEIRKGLKRAVQLTNELKGVRVVQESLGDAQTLITETAQSLEVETLGVEIPSGSTIGEELLTSLQNNGEGLNIWDEDSAELWGAMILENQDDGFFTDALAMAESVGDEEWIQFAHEMGLDESTGHFDQAAIMSLVEKANGGDRAAFQKLYSMFHWVRAGDTVKIPTNIQALMENGLTNFENVSSVTPEIPGIPEVPGLPSTEEVTSIITETPNVTTPLTEVASLTQDTAQLEAELFNETMLQADTKAADLMESIKRISGSEDPIADLLDKLEESGDRIKELEGLIGPVAEKIEELTEEIEDTYQEFGGIETLADAYFRVTGLIADEPEYLEQLAAMKGEVNVPVEETSNVWPYLGAVVLGKKINDLRKRRKARRATTTATTTTVPTPVTPPTQPAPADALPNLADTINVGQARDVTPTPQPAPEQTAFVPGQIDANTFSTLGSGYDVEFTYGAPQNNSTAVPEAQPQAMQQEQSPIDEITRLKQQERQAIPEISEDTSTPMIEKQPDIDTLLDDEAAADSERQKREKLAEQQRLADAAIEEAYKERATLLAGYRDKGVIPFYREVIEFKPIALEGVTTRKIPVPKVELIETSDKMNFTDLRNHTVKEVRREIERKLVEEDPNFDLTKDKAKIDALIDSPVNQKAINSRLERILSPELNMTGDEALRYPDEKRSRELLLNFLKVYPSGE